MYITTSHNPNALDLSLNKLHWPGPHLLRVDPGRGYSDAEQAIAEARFVVFEYVTPPIGVLDSLRTMIIRGAMGPARPAGPLLFTERGLDTAAMQNALAATLDDPYLIDVRQADGASQPSEIILGLMVVENPSFPRFFRNMQPGLDDRQLPSSFDIMRRYFAPPKDNEPYLGEDLGALHSGVDES